MSGLYPSDWVSYLEVFRIFLRALGLFLLVPGFSHKAISLPIKILLALALSLALYPVVKPLVALSNPSLGGFFAVALSETTVGFFMGFIT